MTTSSIVLSEFLSALGPEIIDASEETFLLFTQPLPSQTLGFVSPQSSTISITILNKDLTIHQSPTLLSSNRPEGTTGAVVWKITPLFAEWIAAEGNVLFRSGLIGRGSTVLELGCGVSGILALSMSEKVGSYVATDLDYVFKLLRKNLEENVIQTKKDKKGNRHRKGGSKAFETVRDSNITVMALDWVTSSISLLPSLLGDDHINGATAIDAVIACDCIYNEALMEPFVLTCADICRLAKSDPSGIPTMCIVAQQLRSDTVFEAWLSAFCKEFRVWRFPDELLIAGLKEGTGFVVHVGILRDCDDTRSSIIGF